MAIENFFVYKFLVIAIFVCCVTIEYLTINDMATYLYRYVTLSYHIYEYLQHPNYLHFAILQCNVSITTDFNPYKHGVPFKGHWQKE